MGRRCTICHHENRPQIDRELSLRTPIREIAAKFGVKQAAVGRHKIKCCGVIGHGKRVSEGGKPAYVGSLPSRELIHERMEAITTQFNEIAATCHKEGAFALSISALDKLRLSLADIARLSGYSGTGSDRSVHVNVGVNVSAQDIGASLAQHLSGLTVEPLKLVEAIADEP
jgi:hypothetical protein